MVAVNKGTRRSWHGSQGTDARDFCTTFHMPDIESSCRCWKDASCLGSSLVGSVWYTPDVEQ
eukprot:2612965-Amphidinium_carterae.2